LSRKKRHTVEVEDDVVGGIVLFMGIAKKGILEATEPGLLDFKLAVLDLLELHLKGETPIVDGGLGVTVKVHGTRAKGDPDNSLAAREELNARVLKGGGELLLKGPLVEDVDVGALPCGLPECLEDEVDSLLRDCDDFLKARQDSLADNSSLDHVPITQRAVNRDVGRASGLVRVDNRQLIPERSDKSRT
jgi:hypothetical protein